METVILNGGVAPAWRFARFLRCVDAFRSKRLTAQHLQTFQTVAGMVTIQNELIVTGLVSSVWLIGNVTEFFGIAPLIGQVSRNGESVLI